MSHTTYFEKARNVTVDNLTVIQQPKTQHIHCGQSSKSPLERLEEKIAPGALHNSDERCDAPKCHPETRVAVQGEILSWISRGDADARPKKIMWISGPAGSGKTAIAGSVAEACKEQGILAASFFFSSFSGSLDRRVKKCFVTTIAYQLRQHPALSHFGQRMLGHIDQDPAILDLRLGEQLEALILNPLREGYAKGAQDLVVPKVIVIDGLDECGPDTFTGKAWSFRVDRSPASEQREILFALKQAADDSTFPFRIIVSSRPERVISDFFSEEAKDITAEIFLDDKYDPDSDIALFLRSKFTEIRRIYNLPQSWPGDKAIQLLVEDASGQFIYAATIIRFVQEGPNPPPLQLDSALKLRPVVRGPGPFEPLDALYTYILKSSPDPQQAARWIWMTQAHIVHNPGYGGERRLPALFARQLLESTPGEAEHLLGNLRSLIRIPPPEDRTSPYVTYHKSMMDFIGDQTRSHTILVRADRTLRDSFEYAVLRVFMNKGPAIPLDTEWELDIFLDRFLAMDVVESLSKSRENYDESWWALRMLSRPDQRQNAMTRIYELIHVDCSLICRKQCRRWRKALLKECKSHGWNVPGRFSYLLDLIAGGDCKDRLGANQDEGPSQPLRFSMGSEQTASLQRLSKRPKLLLRIVNEIGEEAALEEKRVEPTDQTRVSVYRHPVLLARLATRMGCPPDWPGTTTSPRTPPIHPASETRNSFDSFKLDISCKFPGKPDRPFDLQLDLFPASW
ncbi:hypothetical protein DFP72DRAFT_1167547 [Ephemerocybe angulata]|uniref:Nephrocystin 3-like N-terminal domain-containing protein n=1 Tax=Ephemerocybe angulata TaxID=980116 RepID=A0A8H6I6D4_9AGAR|nr:hypothetical protein DFP72DRAFT_1167547 [Tulosesus angulatus]